MSTKTLGRDTGFKQSKAFTNYGTQIVQRRKGMHKTLNLIWASLMAQLVKNPPAMQKPPVPFLGWEDPLEKG